MRNPDRIMIPKPAVKAAPPAKTSFPALIIWAMLSLVFFPVSAVALPDRPIKTFTVGARPWAGVMDFAGQNLYVTGASSNAISIINIATGTVNVNAITVGNTPQGLALTPDGRYLYVANQGSNTVSKVDVTSRQVIKTIGVDAQPVDVIISKDGLTVFVSNYAGGTVSLISTASDTVSGGIILNYGPWGLALDPTGQYLYVAGSSVNAIFKVRLADLVVIVSGAVDGQPLYFAASNDGTYVYVTCTSGGTVLKLSAADLTVNRSVNLAGNPVGLALTNDNNTLFVADTLAGNLKIINTADMTITANPLSAGQGPAGVRISADGHYLFSMNSLDNTVTMWSDLSVITIVSLIPTAINKTNSNLARLIWKSDTDGDYLVEIGGTGPGTGNQIDAGKCQKNVQITTTIKAADLGVNDGQYTINIYVTSNGQTSGANTIIILDTIPPTRVLEVKAGLSESSIPMTWQPAVDNGSGVGGYKIYYGTTPGRYDAPNSPIDAGNTTKYTLNGLQNGTTYYLTVSAYDKATNEGEKSDEVSQMPSPIQGLVTDSGGGCFIATAAFRAPRRANRDFQMK
ncbi:MAG: beta-propeller fold lactonase family protein [Deltaproteobacteria bacterium]|nr:beta-propeller fold lactonase family protein [Deltaproteobacteria bacterium]